MTRLGGSIGGPGAARSCLLLDRDPDDPDKERGTRRVLAHFKCNVGPLQPSRTLNVEAIHLEASNLEPPVDTARITDTGESPHTAETLLQADEDGGGGTEATDFLLAELGDGDPIPAVEIKKRARQAGIAESTLNRAKKRARCPQRTLRLRINRPMDMAHPKDHQDSHVPFYVNYGKQ